MTQSPTNATDAAGTHVSVQISDKAFASAGNAAAGAFAKWYRMANREAYVDVMAGQCARVGVQAAAPMVVADELERLAKDVEPTPDEYSVADYWDDTVAIQIRAAQQEQRSFASLLRRRASELRGETVA